MAGFFSVNYELSSIQRGIDKDLVQEVGTTVLWYRFDETSPVDDIYDVGEARVFHVPLRISVIAAVRVEGRDQRRDEGLFTRDRLEILVAWKALDVVGLEDIATDTERYLKDRVVYDDVAFTVRAVEVEGQLNDQDTIVSISLEEVRDDEQYFDAVLPPSPY